MWRSEANLGELGPSLYHTDPRNLTRPIRPGGKLLFTRRHPASPPLSLWDAPAVCRSWHFCHRLCGSAEVILIDWVLHERDYQVVLPFPNRLLKVMDFAGNSLSCMYLSKYGFSIFKHQISLLVHILQHLQTFYKGLEQEETKRT